MQPLFENEFIKNNLYIFNHFSSLIENKNKDINDNPFNLGKFISYLSIPYWGEVLDRGKAVFENGIINSNDFKYVKKN